MQAMPGTGTALRPDADLLNDKRFNASILSIASELAVPVDDVVARYKLALESVLPAATVNDYVAILVEKKVKAIYRSAYRNVASAGGAAPSYAV